MAKSSARRSGCHIGCNVKAATKLQFGGLGGQVDVEQQHIRNALIAFALEVVFGRPQRVVAQPFYKLRQVASIRKDLTEPLIGKPTVIDRGAVIPDVCHIDVARVLNRQKR